MTHLIDHWHKCYPSNWKGLIVPEAMSHPAKYSSKLIRRIYEHMQAEGWVKAGDKVLDPFGGVALGALDAMRLGLDWYGVELEPKFAGLGALNIIEWTNKYGHLPRWGSAHLFNGDSRNLIQVLGEGMAAAVSSPPYADGSAHTGGDDPHPEKMQGGKYHGVGLVGAVSSPPYAGSVNQSEAANDPEARLKRKAKAGVDNSKAVTRGGPNSVLNQPQVYGTTPGQLGAMKAGGFEASISSPPFLQSEGGTPEPKPGGTIDPALYARHAAGNKSANGYGTTDGQLSSMKDGGFQGAVSSPPFAQQTQGGGISAAMRGEGSYPVSFDITDGRKNQGYQNQAHTPGNLASMESGDFDASISSPPYDEARVGTESGQEHCGHGDQYGETDGQLGGADDFWMAARAIAEQVYQALEPGGHACWVVKDYVKNKQVVPFCDQWRQLCEAVGFVTIHEHRAMLVHHKGSQHTLDGGLVEHKTESKSFFRRLAEKNGSPRIDWETVYCMEKPQ